MDWTMVAHAKDSLHRIHSLAYLLIERYGVAAVDAGRRIAEETKSNRLRDSTLAELRAELAVPSADLAYAKFTTDQVVREYLQKFLDAFDRFPER